MDKIRTFGSGLPIETMIRKDGDMTVIKSGLNRLCDDVVKGMSTEEFNRIFYPACCKTDKDRAEYEDLMDGQREEDCCGDQDAD